MKGRACDNSPRTLIRPVTHSKATMRKDSLRVPDEAVCALSATGSARQLMPGR
jgi:hypothetical protein